MLIIKELKTVVICTPRTASTSLRSIVMKKYPETLHPHFHMEADGIPEEYKNYRKIGIVRNPIDRLFSLYKFSAQFSGDFGEGFIKYRHDINKSVEDKTFSEWIVENDFVFNQPYDSFGTLIEEFNVKNILPETVKSQYLFLRPDLGTEIIKYEEINKLEEILNIKLPHLNGTRQDIKQTELTLSAKAHIEKYMDWDLKQYNIKL